MTRIGSIFITIPLLSDVIENDSFCFLSPLFPLCIGNPPFSFGHGGEIVFFKGTKGTTIFSLVAWVFLG